MATLVCPPLLAHRAFAPLTHAALAWWIHTHVGTRVPWQALLYAASFLQRSAWESMAIHGRAPSKLDIAWSLICILDGKQPIRSMRQFVAFLASHNCTALLRELVEDQRAFLEQARKEKAAPVAARPHIQLSTIRFRMIEGPLYVPRLVLPVRHSDVDPRFLSNRCVHAFALLRGSTPAPPVWSKPPRPRCLEIHWALEQIGGKGAAGTTNAPSPLFLYALWEGDADSVSNNGSDERMPDGRKRLRRTNSSFGPCSDQQRHIQERFASASRLLRTGRPVYLSHAHPRIDRPSGTDVHASSAASSGEQTALGRLLETSLRNISAGNWSTRVANRLLDIQVRQRQPRTCVPCVSLVPPRWPPTAFPPGPVAAVSPFASALRPLEPQNEWERAQDLLWRATHPRDSDQDDEEELEAPVQSVPLPAEIEVEDVLTQDEQVHQWRELLLYATRRQVYKRPRAPPALHPSPPSVDVEQLPAEQAPAHVSPPEVEREPSEQELEEARALILYATRGHVYKKRSVARRPSPDERRRRHAAFTRVEQEAVLEPAPAPSSEAAPIRELVREPAPECDPEPTHDFLEAAASAEAPCVTQSHSQAALGDQPPEALSDIVTFPPTQTTQPTQPLPVDLQVQEAPPSQGADSLLGLVLSQEQGASQDSALPPVESGADVQMDLASSSEREEEAYAEARRWILLATRGHRYRPPARLCCGRSRNAEVPREASRVAPQDEQCNHPSSEEEPDSMTIEDARQLLLQARGGRKRARCPVDHSINPHPLQIARRTQLCVHA